MSAIPGVYLAVGGFEQPNLATREQVVGAPWSHDWRDIYPVAPDMIRNHDKPAFLGVLDGTEAVTDWNPWEGVTGPHPSTVIRPGYSGTGVQAYPQSAPLAIDSFDRDPDHGQARLSGVSSIAALVPFIELAHSAPYHFDDGLQIDAAGMGAMGPRQIFRPPPSVGDQTAGIYAAGF